MLRISLCNDNENVDTSILIISNLYELFVKIFRLSIILIDTPMRIKWWDDFDVIAIVDSVKASMHY